MTDYRLDAYDTSGTHQFTLTDFTQLGYKKRVNSQGVLTASFRGDHPLLSSIADKWQFEVWRRPTGQSWYRDFVGQYRRGVWEYKATSTFEITCVGLKNLLARRNVLWYAETNNRSEFTGVKGETIMKTLVSYNAGSSATTGNGRLRTGTITGLSVETDGTHGNTLDWSCAYDNLLKTLQDLALVAGGDFDLVKTSTTTYEFRWYTGQLGTNRTTTVKFSMGLGNMANPVYEENRIDEATVALVAGQGEASARATATRTGANYVVTENDIEMFVDARSAKTTNALNAIGDQKLKDAQAIRSFRFDVLQSPKTLYGVDYFLGDLVTAINPFTGASYTEKVNAVAVALSSTGEEKISIELGVQL